MFIIPQHFWMDNDLQNYIKKWKQRHTKQKQKKMHSKWTLSHSLFHTFHFCCQRFPACELKEGSKVSSLSLQQQLRINSELLAMPICWKRVVASRFRTHCLDAAKTFSHYFLKLLQGLQHTSNTNDVTGIVVTAKKNKNLIEATNPNACLKDVQIDKRLNITRRQRAASMYQSTFHNFPQITFINIS